MTELLGIENLHMWLTFGVIALAVWLYISERIPMETVSLLILCILLFIFFLVPFSPPEGKSFSLDSLLDGFSNSVLITKTVH